jgi:LEA14-like dessication related protein
MHHAPASLIVRVGLVLIGAVGCGCETLKAPSVSVQIAEVAAHTDEAFAVNVPVQMTNPNDVELELRDFRYVVSLNGKEVYRGRRAAQATLPAHADRRIVLPGVVRLDQLGPAAAGAGGPEATIGIQGTLTYVTPGQIADLLFDYNVHKPTVGFSGSGAVPLMTTPSDGS